MKGRPKLNRTKIFTVRSTEETHKILTLHEGSISDTIEELTNTKLYSYMELTKKFKELIGDRNFRSVSYEQLENLI